MRCPSPKKLREVFKLDPEQVKTIRTLASLRDTRYDLRDFIAAKLPETFRYAESCRTDAFDSTMWRTTMVLHGINETMGAYGVEGLGPMGSRLDGFAPPFEYINMGDTYAATLLYNREQDRLFIGCWGDVVERHPEWE